MPIILRNKNGIRTGSYDIAGVKDTIPTQAITSTNLNHSKLFDRKIDFKTKIIELVEDDPNRLLNDPEYKRMKHKEFTKTISENPGYLILFTLNNLREDSKSKKTDFTQENNKILIDFQKRCDFSLIKVFFKNGTGIINDTQHYRKLIPKNKFLACVDENMKSSLFESLYLECLKNQDEMISFFGRKHVKRDNKSNNKNIRYREQNFTFLRSRKEDKILRLSSFTAKRTKNMVNSLVQYFFGLDAYSFRSIPRKQNKKYVGEMEGIVNFEYKPLSSMDSPICVITKKNLQKSIMDFREKGNASIPVMTYNIVKLNEDFKTLSDKYTIVKIKEMLKEVL